MPTVKSPRCEDRVDPETIDERSPGHRWARHWEVRGETQSAYRTQVALGENVESEENPLCDGDELLRSGSRFKWMVPLLGEIGNASSCGVPAVSETGLLERSEWKGALVSAGEGPDLSMGPGRNEFAGRMAPR
jgi:hypothetical protein